MSLDAYAALTETEAPTFVQAGGHIVYEEVINGGKKEFVAFGIKPNGERIKCVVGRTGKQRIYKSINSLYEFHRRVQPSMETFAVKRYQAANLEEALAS